MSSYDGTFKILLLSDSEVGKSAIKWRNVYQRRTPNERLTIGVDFFVKTFVIDKKKYKLQLWDIGREERYRFLLPTYCLGANAVLLLYDVTKPQTLSNIGEWINIVRQKSGEIPISLIGIIPNENLKRQVSAEEGAKIAKKKKLNSFIEINAITGENVGEAFETITRLMLANLEYEFPIKMKKYEEFIVYDLKNTGDPTKLNINPEELQYHLNPKKVLIIILNDLRRIFIWKGAKSPVRNRFISARVAQDLQRELIKDARYQRCKIVSIKQGNEKQEFLNAFGLEFLERFKALSDEESKKKSDRDDDGDDRYPYPYIFKPPEPPDDLALAPQSQLLAPLKEKEPEEEIYCQYCGMKLTKEEQFTHSCKKKP